MQNHNIVFVVGLGPGDARFLTAQAQSALQQAEVLCGYTVYLDLVRPFPGKRNLFHRHDQRARPLPLGAGNGAGRAGCGAGLLR